MRNASRSKIEGQIAKLKAKIEAKWGTQHIFNWDTYSLHRNPMEIYCTKHATTFFKSTKDMFRESRGTGCAECKKESRISTTGCNMPLQKNISNFDEWDSKAWWSLHSTNGSMKLTVRELATYFNVTPGAVRAILIKYSLKHLPDVNASFRSVGGG